MHAHECGVYTIDAKYLRPELASVYLIVERDSVAIIETAHADSLICVQTKLAELNLDPTAVKYIILTHIHLDHAGGAGAYMAAFPHAKLVVHPRGVRHMIDPRRLEAGVVAVYGQEFVDETYGKLVPIDPKRIIAAPDGLAIDLAGRKLICRDTPGHANHHNIVIDTNSGGIFTGDIFGIAYPELKVANENFIFPTTTPIDFDPAKMLNSIELIESYHPKEVYLTHFGKVENIPRLAADLKRMVAKYVAIAHESIKSPDMVATITAKLNDYIVAEIEDFGVLLSRDEILQVTEMDIQINAQGLAIWLEANGYA